MSAIAIYLATLGLVAWQPRGLGIGWTGAQALGPPKPASVIAHRA
jgi:hypothetical protein